MKSKKSTGKLLAWLDQNLLAILAGFLLVFIPLYPKLPLFDAIPGYIVRIRIEDFLILFTTIIWGIQLLRGKARWHKTLTKIIGAYIIFGLLTTLSAMFLTKTVPLSFVHVAKLYLHYFRRIEYFSLFFIAFSAVKNTRQAKALILSILGVLIAVTIYGYGQKYFYWPVYSTMNREFAKGWRLYLTEHARVPSTFGGHYDAAAYTMMAVIIALAILFLAKNKWIKLVAGAGSLMGLWLLILTASRTSFIGYLMGATALMALALFIKNWKWVVPRWLMVMSLSLFVMLSFGDLSERYTQLLGLNKVRDQFKSALFSQKVPKPDNYISVDELAKVTSPSDTPPTPVKPGDGGPAGLPADVYEEIPINVPELDEKGQPTGNYVPGERTFSENAYKYGLSAAIRLDALWPRAIAGFMKNPLLGAGYSTLTKESVEQFTEAESTDNDFLRALGETGLLGFITFFGAIVAIGWYAFKAGLKSKEPLFKAYLLGFVAASMALLLNAFYIDVFEASKVALSFWGMAGIALALPYIEAKNETPQ